MIKGLKIYVYILSMQDLIIKLFLKRSVLHLGTMKRLFRGTHRQFSENICSEDDLRSRIFGTVVAKFLVCLPLLGFSNI